MNYKLILILSLFFINCKEENKKISQISKKRKLEIKPISKNSNYENISTSFITWWTYYNNEIDLSSNFLAYDYNSAHLSPLITSWEPECFISLSLRIILLSMLSLLSHRFSIHSRHLLLVMNMEYTSLPSCIQRSSIWWYPLGTITATYLSLGLPFGILIA